ncbi:MAG: hypothetical protein ABIJ59_04620 [Pseudomonadota bacterium]
MKIDTSNINLSSTHAFSTKTQVTIEQEMRFSNLFDDSLERFQPGSVDQEKSVGMTDQWYEPTSFKGQEAVALSRQFVRELEKIRQILDSIIRGLNKSSCGCCLQQRGIDRININPDQQLSVKMMAYEYVEQTTYTHHETESTNFFADGIVNTMDGKSIDFTFEMNLAREFFREDQFTHSEKGYTLIDPLIVNLNTTMPQLAQTRFLFDLDMDGTKEDLPFLSPGTGLLSLDKDHDGIINDGSELFGPSTGDGFGELSQYDLDHNLWIDENDDIFDELTIWENDEQGQMQLTKIKEAGIGAIYLAGIETPFDLRDENNFLDARIKKSSIALNEDGSVSSVQEMDWTV